MGRLRGSMLRSLLGCLRHASRAALPTGPCLTQEATSRGVEMADACEHGAVDRARAVTRARVHRWTGGPPPSHRTTLHALHSPPLYGGGSACIPSRRAKQSILREDGLAGVVRSGNAAEGACEARRLASPPERQGALARRPGLLRKSVTKPPLAIIVCSGVCTPLQLMLQPSAQTIETARRALLAAKSFSTAGEQAGQDAEDGEPKTKVVRTAMAL